MAETEIYFHRNIAGSVFFLLNLENQKKMKSKIGTSLIFLAAVLELTVAGKIVCYYGSWASYRLGDGKMDVQNIDPKLCTHLVYSFAGLDEATGTIKSMDPFNDLAENSGKDGYRKFTNLVKKNKKLIPMLAIGGWKDGSEKYSKMAASKDLRKKFIDSVVAMLRQYKFKGFDVDWEYPTQRGGSPNDRANFVTLLKELNKAFNRKYQLSIAVGVGSDVVKAAYDVKNIAKYVDHINLMLYDMHSEGKTSHNAPLDQVKKAIEAWIKKGAPASKLILGTGAYGRSFKLADPKKTSPGSKTIGGGNAGPITAEVGYLGYNEICNMKWTVKRDSKWQAPYAFKGDQWVGYDDPTSIKAKCKLARQMKLGGGMIWSIDTDDQKNKCHGGSMALTKALRNC